MSIKIFVTGFQGSGTSLVRRVIESHPDVRVILHEKRILNMRKEDLNTYLGFDMDSFNWGEKLPFLHNKLGKFNGTIFDYVKKWEEYFSPNHKLICVFRHPCDVIFSNLTRRGVRITRTIDKYNYITPLVFGNIVNRSDCLSVKFEDVLLNFSNIVKPTLEFLGLSHSDDIIATMEGTRWEKKRDQTINKKVAFKHSGNKVSGDINSRFPNIYKHIKKINNAAGGIMYRL